MNGYSSLVGVLVFTWVLSTAAAADATTLSPLFQVRAVAEFDPGSPLSDDLEELNLFHVDQATGRARKEVLRVNKAILLTENDLERAETVTTATSSGHPEISIFFNQKGQERLAAVTRDNIGKRLAIIIDGQLHSAPVVRSEISGGKAVITGMFTQSEADGLTSRIMRGIKGSPSSQSRSEQLTK